MRLLLLLLFTISMQLQSFSQKDDGAMKSALKNQEWTAYHRNDSTIAFYINVGRSKKSQNKSGQKIIKTWIKQISENFTYHEKVYNNATLLFFTEFNCDKDEMRIIESYCYDSDGSVIFGGKMTPPKSEWQTTIPSSTGDEWRAVVCSISKYL